MEWQPIKNLKLDGRQVMFKSPAGEFEAPALEPKKLRPYEAAAIYREDGSWPNIKFNATHWRELHEI